jgi:hypothetical protein
LSITKQQPNQEPKNQLLKIELKGCLYCRGRFVSDCFEKLWKPGAIVRIVSIFIIIFLFPSLLLAKREHPEKWYQERWCREQGGQIEVILPDRTRCDCVTDTHAIEFDFGNKWTEAVGQSLYYSLQPGKKAGIVLILENVKDRKYWIRLNTTIEHFNLPIDIWSIGNAAY